MGFPKKTARKINFQTGLLTSPERKNTQFFRGPPNQPTQKYHSSQRKKFKFPLPSPSLTFLSPNQCLSLQASTPRIPPPGFHGPHYPPFPLPPLPAPPPSLGNGEKGSWGGALADCNGAAPARLTGGTAAGFDGTRDPGPPGGGGHTRGGWQNFGLGFGFLIFWFLFLRRLST